MSSRLRSERGSKVLITFYDHIMFKQILEQLPCFPMAQHMLLLPQALSWHCRIIKGRGNEWTLSPYLNPLDLWLTCEGELQLCRLPYFAKDLKAVAAHRGTAHGQSDGRLSTVRSQFPGKRVAVSLSPRCPYSALLQMKNNYGYAQDVSVMPHGVDQLMSPRPLIKCISFNFSNIFSPYNTYNNTFITFYINSEL